MTNGGTILRIIGALDVREISNMAVADDSKMQDTTSTLSVQLKFF